MIQACGCDTSATYTSQVMFKWIEKLNRGKKNTKEEVIM